MFTREELDAKVAEYMAGAQAKINQKFASNYPNLTPPTLVAQPGKRYVKIINQEQGNNSSVFAFLDTTNGDILKPATWKTPAKHARGNLFDVDSGLSRTTSYGPEYLK